MRRVVMGSVVAVLGGLLWAGCAGEPAATEAVQREVVVCASGATVEGIDVSSHQNTVNWSQVAADGIVFAFIRVSFAAPGAGGSLDDEFAANWSGAQAAGIIRGVYQFFLPSQDPIVQADFLIAQIGGAMTPGDLPPVIDVEWDEGLTPNQIENAVQQWITRIENQLGVTPIVYTRRFFWEPYVNSSAFSGYPLWVANYDVTCPDIPAQWSDWAFHQYTQTGSVSGVGGNVDRDVFNGDLAALQAMTYGDPVCGDGYCNGSEDHASCPQDCPACEPIPPLGRIVDETDLCFEAGGDPQWWRTEEAGWDSTLMWTHTVDTQVDNFGLWNLTFDEAGEYRLEAFTDAAWAQSQYAVYQVRHGTTVDPVTVDQSAVDGWNEIGSFQFAAGGDQWVRLEDLTGEPLATNTQIVFDAIQITRLDPAPDAGVEPDGGEIPADGGPGVDADVDPDNPDSGCSCRSGGSGSGPGPSAPYALIWLGLIWWLARGRKRA